MVSEIDLVLVLAEAIGKAVPVDRAEPMPALKIVADGRTEIAEAVVLKMEGNRLALRSLYTKRPIEPVLRRVAKLVFNVNVGLGLLLYKNIPADKIFMYYHCLYINNPFR